MPAALTHSAAPVSGLRTFVMCIGQASTSVVGMQVAALQAEAKDSENEAERQKLQLEAAREEGDRLRGQIVEVTNRINELYV